MTDAAFPAASPARLIAVVAASLASAMWGMATFPALQPTLIEAWNLTNTDAGWINGVYFLAYVVAVPLLTGLTDRHSARRIFVTSVVITGVANLGFAVVVDGFWSALILRGIAGVAFSGIYMPGLKLLTDHLEARRPGGDQSRGVAFYTASVGIGVAFSYFIAGHVAELAGWQWAFAAAGSGSLLGIAVLALGLPAPDPAPAAETAAAPKSHLPDFRPVFRSRAVRGYVLAYATHSFEVIGFRSWVVSYLVFVAAAEGGTPLGAATMIAAALSLMGPPSNIAGNEAARRFDRLRVGTLIALAGLAVGSALGLSTGWPLAAVVGLSVLYTFLVNGDSSVLTAGLLATAPPGYKGATMAVYSAAGFLGAGLGPLVFGVVLDIAGGGTLTATAWFWAFIVNAAIGVSGPLALRRFLRSR